MGYKLKRATMRVNNATRGLPSEYQEVEYIQTTGTQWIDTGYKYISPNIVKYELSYNLTSASSFSYFGARTQSGTGTGWSGIPLGGTIYSNTSGFGNFATSVGSDYILSVEFIPSISETNLIQYTNGTQTYNQTYSVASYMPPTQTENIGLFCDINGDGTAIQLAQMKAYSFKIWVNTELVRDFVPCYRKADTVIGMYDLVNDVFYTNSGTGTFTKGADVPSMIEKQVRPTPTITQLYYDFTQSDGGWTPYNRSGNAIGRDTDGWYKNGTWSDGLIIAPSEIYVSVPNKITITYTKNLSYAGIGCFLATDISGDGIMASDYNHYSDFCTNVNGTTNYSSMGSNITGDITWEIDIDSSTTPRTVTHTFNSNIVINKNDGVMDNIWGSNNFMVRLCQWSSGTKAICFKTITFEY